VRDGEILDGVVAAMGGVREVMWEGDSRERLRGFPDEVKWLFGRALYEAQLGKRN
jgi:hypothetical protein